jgi:DNA-directed RNA polymerase subunit H
VGSISEEIENMAKFKVTDHFMVPDHILLSEKDVETVLKQYKITRDQLPKIKQSDPCIRSLEAKGEVTDPGKIVKIVRKSETAGEVVAYRVIIEG